MAAYSSRKSRGRPLGQSILSPFISSYFGITDRRGAHIEREKGSGRWWRANRKTQSGEHKRVAAPIRPSPSPRSLLVRFHSKKNIILQLAMSTVSDTSLRNGSLGNNSFRSESFSEEKDMGLVREAGCLSIIVLGASGDLAKKKTFPALFHLFQQGFLQENDVHIFGYARTKLSDDDLRERIRGYLGKVVSTENAEILSKFLQLIKYVSGSYDSEEGFQLLDMQVSEHETSKNSQPGTSRRLFYLALPPSLILVGGHALWLRNLRKRLGICRRFKCPAWRLVLRFANRFFMPLWNRDNIDNIQIVFREDFGTEGRGGYFDEYGIIRDIIQNHLLQVLCLVAMEKPVSLKPEHIRDEKVKVLQSVLPIKPEEVVLGQYKGYKDDPTVSDSSNTPTFATAVLRIHNERWEGVPFILKAGKALNSRKAEIRVQFKDVPGDIFKSKKQGRNEFVIRLQPSEAMYMKLTVKKPGLQMSTIQSELDLSYGLRYQDVKIPEAYERLILDTIRGDQQHFVRRDELRVAWEIFTPLLHSIDEGQLKPISYKPGSRGPAEADELLAKAGYVQTHGYIWIPPTLA
ncbi:hypothetical protein C4D60_Mb06t29200 [Musa balbisiana]|uniref:glucose-6-phosphate dehydrogenase (NADP(+)) n=1 Tax=Musa balbisiana TaxID=52838 RepID=A0A4S8IRH4_MUSBA|nr:hypothetical protein C4D60_Mb06t29200 [Musa balbisiana]